MKVKEIIKNHLEGNGFSGLFSADGGCGCKIDDMAPCDNLHPDCETGYKHECKNCINDGQCHVQGETGGDYCISISKEMIKHEF
jgi:hypothetical protein